MRRVAFITGGTSGIGLAVADRFEREGFRVYVTGRRERFERFEYFRVDVRDEEGMARVLGEVGEREGKIDVLVANAGFAYVATVEDTPLEVWRELVDVNLTGVFITVKHALPLLGEGGHVFVMGSIASRQGFPGWSAYCATKFGVYGFALSLAEELKGRVKVTVVMPGAVDTPLWRGLAYVPKKKMLAPRDVADAIWDAYKNPGWMREILILPPEGVI